MFNTPIDDQYWNPHKHGDYKANKHTHIKNVKKNLTSIIDLVLVTCVKMDAFCLFVMCDTWA